MDFFFDQLTIDLVDGRAIVAGEIDAASSEQMLHALTMVRRPGGAPTPLDLTDVTFVDSRGVQMLQRLHDTALATVVAASPIVERMLQLAGSPSLVDTTPERQPAPS